jgi:hypothetical protein
MEGRLRAGGSGSGRLPLLVLVLLSGLIVPGGIRGTAARAETAAGGTPPPAASPLDQGAPDPITIGLPPVLRLQEGVKDPVFGVLVGLVEHGIYGTLTEAGLEAALAGQDATSDLPYRTLDDLTRLPVLPGRTALVRVRFRTPLNLPIPYSILGYHPGSFNVSQTAIFREWIFPSTTLVHEEVENGKTVQKVLELQDVHLFGLQEGRVFIDIDGWLDALMGDALDDTDVSCLMLCRYQGKWLGFAMGYSKDGGGRSGAFSFAKDAIVFPTPGEMRTVGREMRRRKELLMQSWQAPEQDLFAPGAAPASARP